MVVTAKMSFFLSKINKLIAHFQIYYQDTTNSNGKLKLKKKEQLLKLLLQT